VGKVEMRDSTYEMRSDSVAYNTDLDHADFFRHTNIWNEDGDYLEGDRGSYDRLYDRYVITENGYILTAKEELWSDSLDYRKEIEHVTLRHNIQIDDTEHMTLAFGDYAEYYREPGTALLTRDPALVGYDTSQGDTLFMRSDTILYLTTFTTRPEFNPWAPKPVIKADSVAVEEVSTSSAEEPATEVAKGEQGEQALAKAEELGLKIVVESESWTPSGPDEIKRCLEYLNKRAAK
jgi:lipopolysaccharide assembly outer membrane protein LptD (OstA)